MNAITLIEDELEQHDRIVKAAENWAPIYRKDKDTQGKMIRVESSWQRALRRMFRDQSAKVENYIDWSAYNELAAKTKASRVDAAVTIETVVKGDFFDGLDSDFITISFDPLSTIIATGAQAGESIYKIPLGIKSTDAIIQELTTDRIAWLVGKRVDKSGLLVDNPKAEYRISNKTREDIVKAIQTSLAKGEERQQIIDRLIGVVKNPARAEQIAQTESVNAYNAGLIEFGKESGAVGKESQDFESIDYCGEYADEGIVPIDYLYGGVYYGPAYHPGCRCGLRLVYAAEARELGLLGLLSLTNE